VEPVDALRYALGPRVTCHLHGQGPPVAPPPARAVSAAGPVALLLLAALAAGWALRPTPVVPPPPVPPTSRPPQPAPAVPRMRPALAPPPAPQELVPTPPPTPTPAPPVTVACAVDAARASVAPGRWPVSSSWHRGASGWQRALAEQERSQASLLVYFYTDWCGYCRTLERDLLADREVERYLRSNVVKSRVNPELSSRDDALAKSFGVGGYPTLYLVAGTSRTRLSAYTMGPDGAAMLQSPEAFISGLEADQARRGRALLDDGRRALDGENPGRAVELLDAALALRPDDDAAYLLRGRAWLARGDEHRAVSDLKASADRLPRAPEPYRIAAQHFLEGRRWEESIACWNAAIERAATAESYLGRARGHAERGDSRRSREDAAEACRRASSEGCTLAADSDASSAPPPTSP